MNKLPFITKEKAQEIIQEFPTPFHIYDEKGIRQNAENLKKAFVLIDSFPRRVYLYDSFNKRMPHLPASESWYSFTLEEGLPI